MENHVNQPMERVLAVLLVIFRHFVLIVVLMDSSVLVANWNGKVHISHIK